MVVTTLSQGCDNLVISVWVYILVKHLVKHAYEVTKVEHFYGEQSISYIKMKRKSCVGRNNVTWHSIIATQTMLLTTFH